MSQFEWQHAAGCGARSSRSDRRDRRRLRSIAFTPCPDGLEDRAVPSTFTVTNTSDGPAPGPAGSLRAAISEVLGQDERAYRLRTLFTFQATGRASDGRILGGLVPTGKRSRFAQDVRESAYAAEVDRTRALFAPRPA